MLGYLDIKYLGVYGICCKINYLKKNLYPCNGPLSASLQDVTVEHVSFFLVSLIFYKLNS
jgi:hypothetical protein